MAIRDELVRQSDLTALNFLNPWECTDPTIPGRANVIKRLDSVCRKMLADIRVNPTQYDQERHDRFLAVLKLERSEIAILRRASFRAAAGAEAIKLFDATRKIVHLHHFDRLAEREQLRRD